MLITKVLGPVNVLVRKGPRAKGQVIHIDKLKRCEGSTPRSWLTAESEVEQPAAVAPHVDATEEAPLSVPENDEMQGGEPAVDVESGAGSQDGGRSPGRTAPAPLAPQPNQRVQPKRNAGVPQRYLQRGRVEEQCGRTVFRMHTLRCR